MPQIDPAQFAYWMGCIAERTGRPLSPPTLAEYASAFADAGLNTEQFVHAARTLFRTTKFWPAPQDFVDVVRRARQPGGKLAAAEAFNAVLASGTYTPHGYVFSRDVIRDTLGEPAAMAFSAIGGTARLRNLTEDERKWVAREYAEAYGQAEQTQDTLRIGAAIERERLPGADALRLGAGET